MKVEFKKEKTESLGRNGLIKTTSVQVLKTENDTIIIAPITSKGNVGRCYISVPIEDVPLLIETLRFFINRS